MYTVVGAILLVASFGTYNIISTITHEKARDIAILKSLGLNERTVRAIFVIEALMIGLAGAIGGVHARAICSATALGSIEFKSPFIGRQPSAARLQSAALSAIAAAVASRRRWRRVTRRRARRLACIRSRSSGARHERSRGNSDRTAGRDRHPADRGDAGDAHPSGHRADHAGARHRSRRFATRNSSPSPARPAPENRRCSICWGCSTFRPRARC